MNETPRNAPRWAFLIAVLAMLFLVLAAPSQETHPTTPELSSAEASIDLSIEDSMRRASDALRAAGLILHKPLPKTIGASNEWVFALINCERSGAMTRVIATVASNPTKRGESYRVCMFLIEFMKTGRVPANSGLTASVIGVWEWSWANAIGSGKSKVTLAPDGKVTSPDPGWTPGDWWIENGKVLVYWPSPFPKTNLHYVMQFTLSPDGRTMSTAAGNYYYSSVSAARVGDVPGAANPPSVGGGTPPAADVVELAGAWKRDSDGYLALASGSGSSYILTTTKASAAWEHVFKPGGVVGRFERTGPKTSKGKQLWSGGPDDWRDVTMTFSDADHFTFSDGSGSWTRVGGAPPTTGGATGGGGGTSGTGTGDASFGAKVEDVWMQFGAPKLPPAPLPLPPVGARNKKPESLDLLAWLRHGGEPTAYEGEPQGGRPACELVSVTVEHVPDRAGPDLYDGQMQVNVKLSNEGQGYVADVYVGGYLDFPEDPSGGGAKNEGVRGISYDGWVPAYAFTRLHRETDYDSPQRGKLRRYAFNMPKVLPAAIRVELNEQLPSGGTRFDGKMETQFNMPFQDYRVSGVVAGKAGNKITLVAAMLEGGASEIHFELPVGDNPKDSSSDINIRLIAKDGDSEIRRKVDIALSGKERWKEAKIDVWPAFRDRDHRNNQYWPNLPNGGYTHREPVWLGGFD